MSVGGDPRLFATVFHKQPMLWHALERYLIPQGGVPLSDLLNGIGSEATCGQIGAMGTKFKIRLYVIIVKTTVQRNF